MPAKKLLQGIIFDSWDALDGGKPYRNDGRWMYPNVS